MDMRKVINEISKESEVVKQLLNIVQNARFIGYAIDVSYSFMTVLTNDAWKERANGLPHNSFLFAASPRWLIYDKDTNDFNIDPTKEIPEIILLRVTEEYELPNEDVWLMAKIDKFKNVGTRELKEDLSFDDFSRNEIQYAGLKCRILGTFYPSENNSLEFGSDLENYYGAKILFVFKPSNEGLESIINFAVMKKQNEVLQNASLVPIGYVRYTSTCRLQNQEPSKARVYINLDDFIKRRTALFGMTRTGKSNTAKILIKAIREAAQKSGLKVSQIIFDINGEYIYPNKQDENKSISVEIENCFVLTLNPRALSSENQEIQPLKFDMLKNLSLAHELIRALAEKEGALSYSTDAQAFLNVDISAYEYDLKNGQPEEKKRAKRILEVYKLILAKSLDEPNVEFDKNVFGQTVYSEMENILSSTDDNQDEKGRIKQDLKERLERLQRLRDITRKSSFTIDEFDFILDTIHFICTKLGKNIKTSSGNNLYRGDFETLVNFAVRRNSSGQTILGYSLLRKIQIKDYHQKDKSNYIQTIIEKVRNGDVVLIDMVYGNERMRKIISSKIAYEIFNYNQQIFTRAEEPPYVIFYIEEAHNLIGKDNGCYRYMAKNCKRRC